MASNITPSQLVEFLRGQGIQGIQPEVLARLQQMGQQGMDMRPYLPASTIASLEAQRAISAAAHAPPPQRVVTGMPYIPGHMPGQPGGAPYHPGLPFMGGPAPSRAPAVVSGIPGQPGVAPVAQPGWQNPSQTAPMDDAARERYLMQQQLFNLQQQHLRSLQGERGNAQRQQLLQQQQQQQQQQMQHQMQQQRQAQLQRQQMLQQQQDEVDVGEEDDDPSEVYAQYVPAKVKDGLPHPDPIVESATLASVQPPEVQYKYHIQKDVAKGRISNAQLETVLYAMMRFEQRLPGGARAGFFLGDGAGVGKGRQIAALVKEFWEQGHRRVLWVSTSNDLRYDARRDLEDMGARKIPVYPPKKDPVPQGNLGKIYTEGVLFITYPLLVAKGGSAASGGSSGVKGGAKGKNGKGSSASLAAEDTTTTGTKGKSNFRVFTPSGRLTQIKNWLGGLKDGECLVVFDECHKAKNLTAEAGASQAGLAVDWLQTQLPNARVLYSSATGASEPRQLAYMQRLGCYGFKDMKEMINMLNKAGLGAVELFCMSLKAMGMYMSRTLSYKGAEFILDTVKLSPVMRAQYDRSVLLWKLLYNLTEAFPRPPGGKDNRKKAYWGAHQRFYRQMLIAAKVERCATLALDAVARGHCVVIGLQSTGEANTNQLREEQGSDKFEDFVSAPKLVLRNLIQNHLFTYEHPELISKPLLDKFLVKVYEVVQFWKLNHTSTCTEAGVEMEKEEVSWAHTLEKRQERRQKVQLRMSMVNAGGAMPTTSAHPAAHRPVAAAATHAAAAAGAAAVANATTTVGDEDEEVLELVEEITPEQAREKRRIQSILAGNTIDLTGFDDSVADEKAAAIGKELLADEEAERKMKWTAKEEKLAAALAEAEHGLKSAQEKVVQMEQKALEPAVPASKAVDGGSDVSVDFELLDADADTATAAAAAAETKADGDPTRGRRKAVIDESDEEDEEGGEKKKEEGGKTAPAVVDVNKEKSINETPLVSPRAADSDVIIIDSDDDQAAAETAGTAAAGTAGTASAGTGTAGTAGTAAAGTSKKSTSSSAPVALQSSKPEVRVLRNRKPAGAPVAKNPAQVVKEQKNSIKRAAGAASSTDLKAIGASAAAAAAAGAEAAAAATAAAAGAEAAAAATAAGAGAEAAAGDAAAIAAAIAATIAAAASAAAAAAEAPVLAEVAKDMPMVDDDEEEVKGMEVEEVAKKVDKKVEEKEDEKEDKEEEEVKEMEVEEVAKKVKKKVEEKEEEKEEEEEEKEEEEGSSSGSASSGDEDEDGSGEIDDYTMCANCGGGDDADSMLLCDGCDAGWHMACLSPPLTKIPKGDWYCPSCTVKGKGKPPKSRAGSLAKKKLDDSEFEESSSSSDADDSDFDHSKRGSRGRLGGSKGGKKGRKGGNASEDEWEALRTGRSAVLTVMAAKKKAKWAEEAVQTARTELNQHRLKAPQYIERDSEASKAEEAAEEENGKRTRQSIENFNHSVKFKQLPDNLAELEKGKGAKKGKGGKQKGGGKQIVGKKRGRGASSNKGAAAKKTRGAKSKGVKKRGKKAAASSDEGDDSFLVDSDADDEEDDDSSDESEEEDEKDEDVEVVLSSESDSGDEEYEAEEDEEIDEAGMSDSRTPPQLIKAKQILFRLLDAQELPINPLDHLVDLLGGEPKVAEMSGRKGMLHRAADGMVQWKARREEDSQKMVNMMEKEDFMNGVKDFAIISEAASTGISLQADRRAKNQKRRFHITLELPWSADKAIQQFGRSHRSNQSSAPIYCMLVTQCGGEYRFAGAVAKRLQSLGALLQGDRRALGASNDLKMYDVDNRWGEEALSRVYQDICGGGTPFPGVAIPELKHNSLEAQAADQQGNNVPMMREFHEHMRETLAATGLLNKVKAYNGQFAYSVDPKSASAVPRFLNRLLGMPLQDQTLIFDYFSQTLDATIKQARSAGKFEEAIEVVKSGVVSITSKQELHKDEKTDAATYLVELKIDDGLSWVNALEYRDKELAEHPSSGKSASALPSAGFYVSSHSSNYNSTGHPTILLATEVGASYADNKKSRSFRLRRPNQTHGWIIKEFELKTKFRLLKEESEAQNHWEFWFEHLEKGCMHGPNCVRRKQEGSCNFGSRSFNKYIVSGAVLPIMKTLFDVVQSSRYGRGGGGYKKLPRALRAKLDDGQTIVGLNLIREDADMLLATLGAH